MSEIHLEKTREAIKGEKASLKFEVIHKSVVPQAVFDLRQYGIGFEDLVCSVLPSDKVRSLAQPLSVTWYRQFSDIEIEKWLLGNKFLNFYERFPST